MNVLEQHDDGKRRCSGYHGKCYHSDDMMVPVHMFTGTDDHPHSVCKTCDIESHKPGNAFLKWQHESKGVSQTEMRKYNQDHPEERKSDKARWLELGDNVIPLPKPVTFDNTIEWQTVSAKSRVRDQKVVKAIRQQYDECSVIGCDYQHYDVAHIYALKHGADDLPDNCLALCPNHHRDLDKGRMKMTFGVNHGDIELKHDINFENVTKAMVELEMYLTEATASTTGEQ